MVVASSLIIVALALTIAALSELAAGSSPSSSIFSIVTASSAIIVLVPLGLAKRRTGRLLRSHALVGDGTLSVIGASLGAAAVVGLVVNSLWRWWWADRVVALVMAIVAATEAWNVLRHRTTPLHS